MTDVTLRSFEGRASNFWWAVVGAPIIQDVIFAYIPYKFLYLPTGLFWQIGIIASILFASIHWYFGKWFVVYAFIMGFIAWTIIVNYGLLTVIIFHSLINAIDWKIGIRRTLTKGKYKL